MNFLSPEDTVIIFSLVKIGYLPKGENKDDIPICRVSPIISKIETTFYFPDVLKSCRVTCWRSLTQEVKGLLTEMESPRKEH